MKDILKKWWFWTIIVLAIIIVVLILIVVLNAIKANSEIERLESSKINLQEENNKIQKLYKELTEKISELQKEEEQEEINNKIEELKQEQEQLEKSIADKNDEKQNLEKELDKLNGDIIVVKGETRSYPAGKLVAGKDFDTGRYKIFGGNANFIVYSRYGELRVNTILGEYGVEEYVYTFENGDEVDAHSAFQMQPIE